MFKYSVPTQVILGISPFNQVRRLLLENPDYKKILFLYDTPTSKINPKLIKQMKEINYQLLNDHRKPKYVYVNQKNFATVKVTNFDIIVIFVREKSPLIDLINRSASFNQKPQIRINTFLDDSQFNCLSAMNGVIIKNRKITLAYANPLIVSCVYPYKKKYNLHRIYQALYNSTNATKDMIAMMVGYSIIRLTESQEINPILRSNYAASLSSMINFFMCQCKKHRLQELYEAQKMFYLGLNNDIKVANIIFKNKTNFVKMAQTFNKEFYGNFRQILVSCKLKHNLQTFNIDFDDVYTLLKNLSQVLGIKGGK